MANYELNLSTLMNDLSLTNFNANTNEARSTVEELRHISSWFFGGLRGTLRRRQLGMKCDIYSAGGGSSRFTQGPQIFACTGGFREVFNRIYYPRISLPLKIVFVFQLQTFSSSSLFCLFLCDYT